MIVPSAVNGEVAWYENNGNEVFTKHLLQTDVVGATKVFAEDIDGDGDLDVIATLFHNGVVWYENDGSQGFTTRTVSTNGNENPRGLFVADIEGDGDRDIFSATRSSSHVNWHENDGAESFTTRAITNQAQRSYGVIAADVDGDGFMDLASASVDDNKFAWYKNDGTQGFTQRVIDADAAGALFLAASDIDLDGDLDFAGAAVFGDVLAWYENDGTGTFSKHILSATATRANSVFPADIDGDGDVDIAATFQDTVVWFQNDGAQSFTQRTVSSTEAGATSVFVSDVDGDGVLDLVASASTGNKVVWYRQQAATGVSDALDFGDAPDTSADTGTGNYQTLLSNGGPSHNIATTRTTLFLGTGVDSEADAIPNNNANGDDSTTSPDDENGLIEPAQDLVLTVGTEPVVRVRATNTTGAEATLYGWIDFNRDGVLDNATERTSVAVPDSITNATFVLTFPTIPIDTTAGVTYARFRLSTDAAAANSTGAASDGEVEDYAATITRRSEGTVDNAKSVKIAGELNGGPLLVNGDKFGFSVAALGDLDGDGVTDLAVGAYGDNTGGSARGAVYVQFMNSNGTVKNLVKIASGTNGGPILENSYFFGSSLAALGDLDGDGVTDLAVGALGDNTGGVVRGAIYVLMLNSNGTVKNSVKIADSTNGGPSLSDGDLFGSSVTSLGDLDGDGVTDLAVGAQDDDTGGTYSNRGAVYVFFLNNNGTAKSSVKIASDTTGGPTLADEDRFGISVTTLGDLDGDGVTDLAVGARGDDTNGRERGAVHVLFLNSDGTVKSSVKIASDTNGGPTLANRDLFGWSVASLGDLDGDGVVDLAVGAQADDTGEDRAGQSGEVEESANRGSVHLVLLNSDGTAKNSIKIADEMNGGPQLENEDRFGSSVTSLGDLDGDGVIDLAIGAFADGGDDADSFGAVHVLFLNPSVTNHAPTVANDIADQNATKDVAFTFAFAANTFADVDVEDSLTFSATQSDGSALPSWLTFTAATRMFSGTPRNADLGTLSIAVTATDEGNASISDTFDIVVPFVEAISVADPSLPSVTATATSESDQFAISSDGRYVAFHSFASNLVLGDTNDAPDVFVKDLTTGIITLVSTNSDGVQGNNASLFPSIAADSSGHVFVTFGSFASNLVAADTHGELNLYVKDLSTGTTTLVNTDINRAPARISSFESAVAVDDNGHAYVAYSSNANNLVSEDTNENFDVFLKDLSTGITTLVSTDSFGVQGNSSSSTAALAVDSSGHVYVLFGSAASNLVPDDTNNTIDVFVKDVDSGVTTLVSTDTNGTQGNNESLLSSIAVDGSDHVYAAFYSFANNLVFGDTNDRSDVFVKDLTTGILTRVSTDSDGLQGNSASLFASIAADNNGRVSVAFTSTANNLVPGDTNERSDVFVKDLTTGTTTLASSNSVGIPGNNDSPSGGIRPSLAIDASGQILVAFASAASTLVANDFNLGSDVFVKNLTSGTTTVVSTGVPGLQSRTAASSSSGAAVSRDGRYVAFTSFDSNLVAGDTNNATDVFVRDRVTGTTTLVSTTTDGSMSAGTFDFAPPSLAVDVQGHVYVAFSSLATNLVDGDTNEAIDVFVKDLTTGITSRVSTDSEGQQGNDSSGDFISRPSIAIDIDGHVYVAFSSRASNLVADDTNDSTDVFVKNLTAGITTRVSTGSDGTQGDFESGQGSSPSLAVDEHGHVYVAFVSGATNLVPGDTNNHSDVFVKDLATGQTVRVNTSSNGEQANNSIAFGTSPSLAVDHNGRVYVAFSTDASNLVAGDTGNYTDVFVKDLATGITTRVSTDRQGNAGNFFSSAFSSPSLAIDGNGHVYVAFASDASNLVAGDTNGTTDVFVKDLTGPTTLVSTDSRGQPGNFPSSAMGQSPSLAVDDSGHFYVAFSSFATNLVAGDFNQQTDVFLFTGVIDNAPSISSIADQSLPPGQSTGAIPFTVSDSETAAADLIVTVTSSNPNAVPLDNIVLEGDGTERTITVTSNNTFGFSRITVSVSDGVNSRSTQFTVNQPSPFDAAYTGTYAGEILFDPEHDGTFESFDFSFLDQSLLVSVFDGVVSAYVPGIFGVGSSTLDSNGGFSVTIHGSIVPGADLTYSGSLVDNDGELSGSGVWTVTSNGDSQDIDYRGGGTWSLSHVAHVNTTFDGTFTMPFSSSFQGFILADGQAIFPQDHSLQVTIHQGIVTFDVPGLNASGIGHLFSDGRLTVTTSGILEGTEFTEQFAGQVSSFPGNNLATGFGFWRVISTPDLFDGGQWSIFRDDPTDQQLRLSDAGGVYEVVADGGDVVIRAQDGTELFRNFRTSIRTLSIIGGDGDDTVILHADDALNLIGQGFSVSGGGQGAGGDAVQIVGNLPWSFDSYAASGSDESFINASDIRFDPMTGIGVFRNFTARLSGVEQVRDELVVSQRVVSLSSAADQNIEFSDVGDANDGFMRLASEATHTSLTFRLPSIAAALDPNFQTATLSVSLGGGADRFETTSTDNALESVLFSVSGNAGDDQILNSGLSHDMLFGGEGNDTLVGGAGNSVLDGEDGNNSLVGGAGNDRLNGGNSDTHTNTLEGGEGIDEVFVVGGDNTAFTMTLSNTQLLFDQAEFATLNSIETAHLTLDCGEHFVVDASAFSGSSHIEVSSFEGATVTGGVGNDILSVNSGSAVFFGGAGDDTLTGGFGDDVLDGGDGSDVVTATGDVDFELRDDQLTGLGIDSLISIEHARLTGGFGGNFINAIHFTLGGVTLDGADGDDRIFGGNSDDELIGGFGNDILGGWFGNDLMSGGEGDDSLTGFDGNDTVLGGAGNDELTGGTSRFNGDEGHDPQNATDGADLLDGGDGIDTLFAAGDFDLVLTDTLLVGPRYGEDSLTSIENANLSGANLSDGISGNNVLDASAFTLGAVTMGGGAGNDTVIGGSGNDEIFGDTGSDVLIGGDGNDFIFDDIDPDGDDLIDGGNGDDALSGGIGNDTVRGGAGNDSLQNLDGDEDQLDRSGGDILDGGDGMDTLRVAAHFSAQFVVLTDLEVETRDANGGVVEHAALASIEFANIDSTHETPDIDASGFSGNTQIFAVNAIASTILGGSGSDVIFTADGDDFISGGNGSDSIFSGGGNDAVLGGAGNDVLEAGDGNDNMDGGAGNDLVVGGNGDDILTGGDGSDLINGDTGNDVIDGGADNDVLQGEAGDDQVLGGLGDDTLGGGLGNNALDGGDGFDLVLEFFNAVSTLTLTDTTLIGIDLDDFEFVNDSLLSIDAANLQVPSVGPLVDAGSFHGRLTAFVNGNGDQVATLIGGFGDDQLSSDGPVFGGDGNDLISTQVGYRVDGGAGYDRLQLFGPSEIDLTLVPAGQVTSIEELEPLTSQLILNQETVLNFSGPENLLTVTRDFNSFVVVTLADLDDWTQGAFERTNGRTLAVFTQGDATLKVHVSTQIQGQVWNDLNGDGILNRDPETNQPLEPGLEGRTVFVDLNHNSLFDSGEPVAVSLSDGSYLIPDTPIGEQAIRQVLPPGLRETHGTQTVVIPPGGLIGPAVLNADFGSQVIPPAELRGVAWDDRNANGLRESDEPGLAGVTVFLDANHNGALDAGEVSRLTSADDPETTDVDEGGVYRFENVDPGTYVVREQTPAGAILTFPEIRGLNDPPFDSSLFGSRTISADGRYEVFLSDESDLVAGDTNSISDIFRRDTWTGDVVRVNVTADGTESNGSGSDLAISADGRFVAFTSFANDLVPNTIVFGQRVFVKDLETGAIEHFGQLLIAEHSGPGQSHASLSADGRYVVFDSSDRSNLVAGDNNRRTDVFVADRETGVIERISGQASGLGSNFGGFDPAISDDGRYVVFVSASNNLVPVRPTFNVGLFITDRETGETKLLFEGRHGTPGGASLSQDGQFIRFGSDEGVSRVLANPFLTPGSDAPNFVVTVDVGQVVSDLDFGNFTEPFTSSIHGVVFNDLNGAGQQASFPAAHSFVLPRGTIDPLILDLSGNELVQSNGLWITKQEVLTVHGTARPGATIRLESGSDDDYDDGITVAGTDGVFEMQVTLTHDTQNLGVNTLRFSTSDAGMQASSETVVVHYAIGSVVRFVSNLGTFDVELLDSDAPNTVANFKSYLDDYTNSIVHRSISQFVIQGGGFTVDGANVSAIATTAPIDNEFNPANSNVAGTLAMAKLGGQPNSATSQWFINVENNSANLDSQNGGFTVFGRLIGEGLSVSQTINSLPTFDLRNTLGTAFTDVPIREQFDPGSGASPSGDDFVGFRGISEILVQGETTPNAFDTITLDAYEVALSPNDPVTVEVTVTTPMAGVPRDIALELDIGGVGIQAEVAPFQFENVQPGSSVTFSIRLTAESSFPNGRIALRSNSNGLAGPIAELLVTPSLDSEPGLSGRTVFLDQNNNGVLDAGEVSTHTAADDPGTPQNEAGTYSFTGLASGLQAVAEQLPIFRTRPNEFGLISATDGQFVFGPRYLRVGQGEALNGVDFGDLELRREIHGTQWLDDNANGIRDPDESGLAGITIYLDLNHNGSVDAGEPRTLTAEDDPATTGVDETGRYQFVGLLPGNYDVREVVPSGFRTTFAPTIQRVDVPEDETLPNGRTVQNSQAQISGDGRFVVFFSDATNFVPNDTNGASDVFVKDLQTGVVTRVSVASDGTQANSDSYFPAISANGRFVVFTSDASNLVSDDTNGFRIDTFVKDLLTGVVERIDNGPTTGNTGEDEYSPSISGDGRYVVFLGGDFDSPDVVLYDRQTGTSRILGAFVDFGGFGSGDPTISVSGEFVDFHNGLVLNLSTGEVDDSPVVGRFVANEVERGFMVTDLDTQISLRLDVPQFDQNAYGGFALFAFDTYSFNSFTENGDRLLLVRTPNAFYQTEVDFVRPRQVELYVVQNPFFALDALRVQTLVSISVGDVLTGVDFGSSRSTVTAVASIASAEATEGSGVVFTITLSNALDVESSVTFSTSNGTATTEDGDYSAISAQTVVFAAGTTSQTVTVHTIGDDKIEAHETFTASLSALSGGRITVSDTEGSATGTINNDDMQTLSISSPTVTEGTGGTKTLTFTVTSASAVQGGFTVAFSNATGTAGASDFSVTTASPLTFAGTANETQTISVDIATDSIIEANEQFTVTLGTVSAATATQSAAITTGAVGTGTVNNDDVETLTISSPTVTEGTGGTKTLTFTVTSASAVQGGFTVAFSNANGTAGDGDYSVTTSSPLSFTGAANETQTISVDIATDAIIEANEQFTVTLGTVAGATATQSAAITTGAVGTGTINNDDVETLTITSPTITEGTGGTSEMTFTVTSPNAVQGGFSVGFRLADVTTDGSDHGAFPTGSLAFSGAAGESHEITVTVNGDTLPERTETLTATLEAVSGTTATQIAAITTGAVGTGSIANDDLLDLVYADTNNVGLTASVVNGRVLVRLNGIAQPQFDPEVVRTITITGGTKDDTIDLTGLTTGPQGAYSHLTSIVLVGGAGIDRITGSDFDETITGGVGNDILDGKGGTNTLVETGNVDFTLTNTALTGVGTDTLARFQIANLTGGAGANTFTVSGWTGRGTIDGSTSPGNTVDRIVAVHDTDMTLTDTSLAATGFGTLTLVGIETANLTGGASANTFDVSGWTRAATLVGGGGADTIAATKDVNFTLTNTGLQTSDGMNVSLNTSFLTANLTGGDSANTFTVSGWTRAGSFAGGGGGDTIAATKNASFTLSDSGLQTGDGMNLSLDSEFTIANLTGGAAANTFNVGGWTHAGTLVGGGGPSDTIVATKDADFTLSNTGLQTSDGMSLAFNSNFTTANLTGGASANTFTVSEWTRGGALAGGGGDDTIEAVKNFNFTLSNSGLQTTDGMNLSLNGDFTTANLTGGASANIFTVSGWTHAGALAGGGGDDTIAATKNVDFTITNSGLQTTDGMNLSLSSDFRIANLTGGASANSFTVTDWTGSGTITGLASAAGTFDEIVAAHDTNMTLTNTSLAAAGFGTLTLAGIETATLTGGASANVFNVSGWTQAGTFAGGGGGDTIAATRNVGFTLSDSGLQASDGMNLSLDDEFTIANLTGGAGANTFNVGGWTHAGTLTGGGGADSIVATKDADFTLTNSGLHTSDGMSLALSGNFTTANLTGGVSENTFTVSDWTRGGALAGGGGDDTIVAVKNFNFTLTNTQLQTSDGMSLSLNNNFTTANLTGGASANTFTVSGWTHEGALFGGGGGDTIAATKNVDFTISNTALQTTDGMNLSLNSDFTIANLTGGAVANSFTVTGWTGTGTINGMTSAAGTVDQIIAVYDADMTLTNTSLAAAGFGTLTLAGLETASLTGGASANVFNVSGWTRAGSLAGGGGGDTIVATKNVNFTLADTGLQTSDGMNLSLDDEFAIANLTGGAGANIFTVGGWSHAGTLTGGGGADSIVATKDADFTLSNSGLHASDGLSLVLSGNFATAKLTGGASENTFTVSDWTRAATLTGGGGADTIAATKDVSFTLSNTKLQTTDGMVVTLNSDFTIANLTGGASANTFTVSGWTHEGALVGGGGGDTIAATKNANFTISNNRLQSSDGLDLSLNGDFTIANLTGGASANSFTVSGWTGSGAINGLASAAGTLDQIVAVHDADMTLTNTSLAAAGFGTLTLAGIETASLTGGASANVFNVSGWTRAGTLAGGGGGDTIAATKNSNVTLSNTGLQTSDGMNLSLDSEFTLANLTGGAGANTFTVSGWTRAGTLVGGGGADTLVAVKNFNFTLSNSGLQTTDGMNLSLLNGDFTTANLTGGASANTFTVGGWNRAGSFVGGGGGDTIAATKDVGFTLSNTKLQTTDGMNLTLNSDFTIANLTGGASANTFTVGGWTRTGALAGGGGGDTIAATKNTGFTISNSGLQTTDGMTLSLNSDFTIANLTGGASANTFIVSGWTGGGVLSGLTSAAGTFDQIVAVHDANMTLTNTSLAAAGFGTLTLAGIETANLSGGEADNQLIANQFTLGSVTLQGNGGNDILVGGSQRDSLDGGAGRDLLIGGAGADAINGGTDEDILVGGTTTASGGVGPAPGVADVAAMNAIMAEWTRTDANSSQEARIANLMAGVGPNGTRLGERTVQNDANAVDNIKGGLPAPNNTDLDWFFRSPGDVLDAINGETTTVPIP